MDENMENTQSRAEKIKALKESLRESEQQEEKQVRVRRAEETIVVKPDTEYRQTAGREPVRRPPQKRAGSQPVPKNRKPNSGKGTPDKGSSKNKNKNKNKNKKKKTVASTIRSFFPEKGDSTLEKIRKIVFLMSIVAIVVCGYLVADYYIDLWKARQVTEEIRDIRSIYQEEIPNYETDYGDTEKYYELLDSAKKLLDINSEIVGYITIPGTPVDNPVVQARDNKKYLNLNAYGQENRAGTLFLDYRCKFDKVYDHRLMYENSDNLVIYGHNMADGSMFGSLLHYQQHPDYYEQHPIIELSSNYEHYKYKIFAFFVVDVEDETATKYDCWNKIDFDDEEDFYNFVNEAKRRTLRINGVDVVYGDKLLTLSTCNTLFGDRGRLIIMARLVREGEDPYYGTGSTIENPNIKWPTMYYNSRSYESYDPDAPFTPYPFPTEPTSEEETEESVPTEERKEQTVE